MDQNNISICCHGFRLSYVRASTVLAISLTSLLFCSLGGPTFSDVDVITLNQRVYCAAIALDMVLPGRRSTCPIPGVFLGYTDNVTKFCI